MINPGLGRNCLADADGTCIHNECAKCGFKTLWSKKLRPKLLDSFGKLKPGASRVWLTVLQWERVKSGGDGSSSEDDLRQSCEGTLLELLDEFEPVHNKWVPHRHRVGQSKAAGAIADQVIGGNRTGVSAGVVTVCVT